MYIRKTKNDSKDSYIIAQIMRFGEYSSSNISDENIFALRQLSRYRTSLVDECSSWKSKVINVLEQIFLEYSNLFLTTFEVNSKELLSKYPFPENIQERFQKLIFFRKLNTSKDFKNFTIDHFFRAKYSSYSI